MGVTTKFPFTREYPNHYLKEFEITKQDILDTREFLSRIGYDINKDIHSQFCLKYKICSS